MDGILNALNVGSGLSTDQIVRDLVAAERAPRTAAITAQRTEASAKVSALGQIRASIGAFSQALSALSSSGALGVQASSDRPEVAAVSVTSPTARPQLLSFEVLSLASRQTAVSPGLAGSDAAIGSGTLTIRFGAATAAASGAMTAFTDDPSRVPLTIPIGAGAATLQGVADAVNKSGAGFTASILTDGTSSRLVLKGPSGAANGFRVDVAADVAGSDIEKLALAPGVAAMTVSEAAADARLLVEGVPVSRASNRITDLAAGLAIDLRKAEVGARVTLAADYDDLELSTAVGNFVDAYNEMQSLVGEFAGRGANDSAERPLRGSRAVRDLQGQLRALTTLPLLPEGGPTRLADIGIRSNRDGSLTLDQAVLAKVMADSPERIGQLFTDSQTETYPGIRVSGSLAAASPGAYQLSGIVAPTAGRLQGAAAPTAFDTPLVIDGSNRAFRVSVDGVGSLALALAEGSYTSGTSFAAAINAAIGRDPLLRSVGVGAAATWSGDVLSFTSNGFGSASSVALTEIDATLAARLGLAAPVATAGTAGSGFIDGLPLTVSGKRMTAPAGSAAAGLVLDVTQDLASGRFEISHGIDTRLAEIARTIGGSGSAFGSSIAALDRELASLAKDEAKVTARSEAYETRLRAQFGAMEAAVAGFKSTQDFLEQQIDIWTNQRQR